MIQEKLRKEFLEQGIKYSPKLSGSRQKRDQSLIELDKVTQFLASSENTFLLQAIDNKGELFDQPYQKIYRKGITASSVYLAWLIGSKAGIERLKILNGIGQDDNSGLLSVTSDYWIIYCAYKIVNKHASFDANHAPLSKMNTDEFRNAIGKYVTQAAAMFWDAAVDTYDRDEYGSFKSVLRSAKFLHKMDSKLNVRVTRMKLKMVPDLTEVCKSAKVAPLINAIPQESSRKVKP